MKYFKAATTLTMSPFSPLMVLHRFLNAWKISVLLQSGCIVHVRLPLETVCCDCSHVPIPHKDSHYTGKLPHVCGGRYFECDDGNCNNFINVINDECIRYDPGETRSHNCIVLTCLLPCLEK